MYLYSSKAHKNHWNLRIRFVNNAKSTVYKSIEEECNVVNRNMTCSPNTLVNEKGFGISPASGTQYGALNISTGLLRRSYLTLFKSFYLLWRPIFQALFWYNLTFIWVCSHHNSHCHGLACFFIGYWSGLWEAHSLKFNESAAAVDLLINRTSLLLSTRFLRTWLNFGRRIKFTCLRIVNLFRISTIGKWSIYVSYISSAGPF